MGGSGGCGLKGVPKGSSKVNPNHSSPNRPFLPFFSLSRLLLYFWKLSSSRVTREYRYLPTCTVGRRWAIRSQADLLLLPSSFPPCLALALPLALRLLASSLLSLHVVLPSIHGGSLDFNSYHSSFGCCFPSCFRARERIQPPTTTESSKIKKRSNGEEIRSIRLPS